MTLCLAPMVLIGQLFTVQTNWHQTADVGGTMIEAQTCEAGIGAHARATTSGLYGLGLHYGFHGEWGKYSVTFQPRAGLSATSIPRRELPSDKQFELGAQLLFGYNRARIGVDYWHLSNAGTKDPNIGVDTVGVVVGWVF